jgi:alkanesulfonate monooxygenase SsuD/methylene tetrahydromethanopterin reductase-like flavin-dependent oxidoreductase (luciferase family)
VSAAPSFGIYLPQIAFDGPTYLERAELIDALGFDSLWMYDHLSGPGLPSADSLEAFVLASWVLARTRELRVGHLVAAAGFRNAALTAKMFASMDVLSGGRLEIGLGSGSIESEHREAGYDWLPGSKRAERLEETVLAIKELFSGEPTDFDGNQVRLEGFTARPRPLQLPHPPVHLGGVGPRYTLPLVARHADVWSVPTYALGFWTERRDQLFALCEEIGRDPASLRISHESVIVIGRDEAELDAAKALAARRFPGEGFSVEAGGYIGLPEQIVEHIERQRAEGVTDFIFFTTDRGGRETLELIADEVVAPIRRASAET